MVCWHCSRQWRVEGVGPSFLENSAKARPPRFIRRNALSCRSSASRTEPCWATAHSICEIIEQSKPVSVISAPHYARDWHSQVMGPVGRTPYPHVEFNHYESKLDSWGKPNPTPCPWLNNFRLEPQDSKKRASGFACALKRTVPKRSGSVQIPFAEPPDSTGDDDWRRSSKPVE